MKRQINVVLNGKSCTGKSFFATNLVQFLKDKEIDHRAIDTDVRGSTLKTFHRMADLVNIRNLREMDLVFGALQYTNLVVVDCHAASTNAFLDYFSEIRVFELLDLVDAALTIILPITNEPDSADYIGTVAGRFQAQCRYLTVRNLVHGEQFTSFEQSEPRSCLMEIGGKEMIMPRLCDWLVTGLYETKFPISRAIDYPGFSLVDRQRLKNWQRIFYEQLVGVSDILLPSDDLARLRLKSPIGNGQAGSKRQLTFI